MPAATPLGQLYSYPPETPIELIVGVLSQIQNPPKTGTGQFGQYSFQSAFLSDGTTTVKVVFKDRAAIPAALNGRKVYIQGTPDGKGVKTKDDLDKKNNKMERVFWITKTATVETQDTPAQVHQPAAASPYAQQPLPMGSATRPYPAAVKPPAQQIQKPAQQQESKAPASVGPRTTIGRMGTVYAVCLKAAIKAAVAANAAEPTFVLEPEHIKDIATTIFIQSANRISLDGVPNILADQNTEQPPQEEPTRWPAEPPPEAAPADGNNPGW